MREQKHSKGPDRTGLASIPANHVSQVYLRLFSTMRWVAMSSNIWKTDERQALRSMVKEFTEKEVIPHLNRWEDEGVVPLSLHKRAADAGLLGISFDEKVGGSGGTPIDVLIVLEEMILAGASSGLIAALFTHGIALPHIVASGNDDLIERFVKPTLAGEMIGSLGITEPSGGSDVANIKTTATRTDSGFLVNGAKTFITSATRADFVTTVVRTGGTGHAGLSLLVIERGAEGFEISMPLRKMGWQCSDTGELSFTDVLVPYSNLVGDTDSAFGQIAQQFQGERLSLAFQASATAQRCLNLLLEWVTQRETFGRPLSSRQVVRHRIADLARDVDVTRTYCHHVAERWVADGGMLKETAMAKNTAVSTCDRVVYEAVQLFGGLGCMRENEVERHYRDARVLGIGGGTTEIMNEIISKLMGL